MLRIAAICVALGAGPAIAQTGDLDEGFDLLDRGVELLFREFAEQMDPAFDELRGMIDNLNAYHPPEVLPNGDIIIRRKTPVERMIDPEDGIDL